jgi:outer membrane murein-binding lipoprotein Lpp
MSDTKRSLPFLILFLFLAFQLHAETPEISLMREALKHFTEGSYREAILDFREIILDERYESFHGAAYYWIARSQIALENYTDASVNLEYFLDRYRQSSFFTEGLYWKGRLLFLQNDTDNAIPALYSFIEKAPEHDLVPSSYFWIGESFFALGHLEKAQRIFQLILAEYPGSVKLEASRYRLSLIELKEREEELMRLLKMSHEEYLFALEEFQRREKAYDQAIVAYQRKLTAYAANDKEALVQQMSREIDEKDLEIATLTRQVDQLKSRVENLTASVEQLKEDLSEEGRSVVMPPAGTAGQESSREKEELIRLKSEALQLKEAVLDLLLSEEG